MLLMHLARVLCVLNSPVESTEEQHYAMVYFKYNGNAGVYLAHSADGVTFKVRTSCQRGAATVPQTRVEFRWQDAFVVVAPLEKRSRTST